MVLIPSPGHLVTPRHSAIARNIVGRIERICRGIGVELDPVLFRPLRCVPCPALVIAPRTGGTMHHRAGSCVGEDIFRSGNPPKGTCGGSSNTTVARGDDSPFTCGDVISIFTTRTPVHKTVTDRCPACTGKKQLDNYTTDGRCTGIPDLGNFIVVKVKK